MLTGASSIWTVNRLLRVHSAPPVAHLHDLLASTHREACRVELEARPIQHEKDEKEADAIRHYGVWAERLGKLNGQSYRVRLNLTSRVSPRAPV